MIGVDDLPALGVVALCLKELRGMRVGLELTLASLRAVVDGQLAELRQDLRTVLSLLVGRQLPAMLPAQGGAGGAESRGGIGPARVEQGEGAGQEREAVDRGGQGVEEIAGL